MMDANSWEKWAKKFNEHVFDIANVDARRVLRKAVSELPKSRRSRLIDLGCGNGTFLRQFGSRYDHCVGVDFSEHMLRMASIRCQRLPSTQYIQSDIAKFKIPDGKRGDLIACFNVATHPLLSRRKGIWRTVSQCLEKRGTALIVVPSLESAQWVAACAKKKSIRTVRRIGENGIVRTDGVEQKFFRSEEIRQELQQNGFKVIDVRKIWFPWKEESLDGRLMRGSEFPWDWLAICQLK